MGASVFPPICLSGRHGQCWYWPDWAHTVASKLPGPFKHSSLGLSVDLDREKRLEGWLLCCNLPQSPHIWTYKGSNLWPDNVTALGTSGHRLPSFRPSHWTGFHWSFSTPSSKKLHQLTVKIQEIFMDKEDIRYTDIRYLILISSKEV